MSPLSFNLVAFATLVLPLLYVMALVMDLVGFENKPLQCPLDRGNKSKRRS